MSAADFFRRGFLSAADFPSRTQADFVRQESDFCPRRTRAEVLGKSPRRTVRQLAADPPESASDPPESEKSARVRQKSPPGPPESAISKSAADSAADPGGLWRTQADSGGSAADSGGLLRISANSASDPPESEICYTDIDNTAQ